MAAKKKSKKTTTPKSSKKKSKTAKKSKNVTFLRYEFSNSSGKPEGGDIFQFSNSQDVREMVSQILEVAQGDEVAVNLTIGGKKAFFGFLANVGLDKKAAEAELVTPEPIILKK